jgi:hypothetical protein
MNSDRSYINFLGKIFFSFCLFVIGYRYFNNSLLSQLEIPILINPQANNTYWILLLLNIPQWCIENGRFIDTIMLFSCIGAFLKPQQKFFSIVFFIAYTTYLTTYNIYNIHHNHSFIGVWVMSFVFCFSNNFRTVLNLARYYALFIIASAGLWKVFRGAVFKVDHLSTILTNQFNEAYISTHTIVPCLIENSSISHFIFLVMVILQLIFMVGFFTKKHDKWLVLLFFLFFISDYIIMGLPFIEIYPLLLSFIQKDHLIYFLNKFTRYTSKIKTNVS